MSVKRKNIFSKVSVLKDGEEVGLLEKKFISSLNEDFDALYLETTASIPSDYLHHVDKIGVTINTETTQIAHGLGVKPSFYVVTLRIAPGGSFATWAQSRESDSSFVYLVASVGAKADIRFMR